MDFVAVALATLHLVFAGVWTGSVVFVTLGVVPTAASGDANAAPLATLTDRLKLLSRTSAVFLLVTGAYLAVTRYPGSALVDTTRGNFVLAMVVLWFLLAALVEVGARKLGDGFARQKVRTPAREARPFFRAGSFVAVLALVDAGIILAL